MATWCDHNAHYQPLLLRQLPQHCDRVLDVGCGAGGFARRLARQAGQVDAVDRSADMIMIARRWPVQNVAYIEADVLTADLPDHHYDAITSISALHHMPLAAVLPRLGAALRPGGVLAAIALPKSDLPRELPLELGAAVATRALGVGVRARRLRSRTAESLDSGPAIGDPPMPMEEPVLTVREVRRQASEALPGVEVRRLLLWRYLLVWHKP
jgi:SAM-dependent methyltransferase